MELEKRVERLENEKLELIKVYRNLHKAALWYSLPRSPFNSPRMCHHPVLVSGSPAGSIVLLHCHTYATTAAQKEHCQ